MTTSINTHLGTIFVDIDYCGCSDLIISAPEPGLKLYFNPITGGLVKFQVDLDALRDCSDGIVQYEADEDTLYINLTEENSATDGLCDLIYIDRKQNILISANRNAVGNLVGIEIIGATKVMSYTE
jgi:uncharacterized protein YuzE